jgi:hypothetical protein
MRLSPRHAEVSLLDDRRSNHGGGIAIGGEPALVQHDDAVGKRAHDVHLVLDQEDRLGHVALQPRDQVEHDRNLVDAHAGGRLAEHEDAGLERHHHRHFELALVAVRQRGGALVALCVESDALQRRVGALDQRAAQRPWPSEFVMDARRRLGREPYVLEHAERGEEIGELEGAPEAEPRALRRAEGSHVGAVDEDLAAGRAQLARHQVEIGCLARAVGPDDRCQLAGPERARHRVDRNMPAEADRQVSRFEGGRGEHEIRSQSGPRVPSPLAGEGGGASAPPDEGSRR